MIQQLIDEKNKFIEFSINNKFLYFIIALATMLSYGIKLVGLNISIDTEAIIDDFDVQMNIKDCVIIIEHIKTSKNKEITFK